MKRKIQIVENLCTVKFKADEQISEDNGYYFKLE